MAWQLKVPGCFGDQDVIFANHPSDEQRARETIRDAKNAGASKDEFRKEAIWHIYSNVTDPGVRQERFEAVEAKINKIWK